MPQFSRQLVQVFILLLLLIVSVPALNIWGRVPPKPLQHELAPGIHHQRLVRRTPRPIVIHVVRFDLRNPHLRFFVTPPHSSTANTTLARTGSEFVGEFDLQLAINANYFYPSRGDMPWYYYPHSGDSVTVLGLAASNSVLYGHLRHKFTPLYFLKDGSVQFSPPQDNKAIQHAIAGFPMLVEQGKITSLQTKHFAQKRPYPRVAIALDKARQTLWWVLVDGKQNNYSEGMTLLELAQFMLTLGVEQALSLDGGGSVTLVQQNTDGKVTALNSPIHAKIPGWERPVANHLGVRWE